MSVHYKFKSALEYDTVTFDGLHISVKDLKNAIIQQKRIGKNTDFDLQVTNAQTKEVYEDDDALIPKNTSLLIARIPVVNQTKSKTWEGYGGDSTPPSRIDDMGALAKAVDLANLDASEDDKIRVMMSQSTQDYDPSNYMKIRGANQVGAVPPNYRCYKCHQSGHWIKDCPASQGPEPIEIKKSTGIPRSFMVPVEGPQVPGAMMTPNGSYAVPVLDHQAYTQKQPVPPPVQEEKVEIPEDLICSICHDLLTDAVMIPCCGNSFCDECIRSCLLESEDHECPDCHERDISPGTLIPNRYLRNSVLNFKNNTGYVKRPTYKPITTFPEDITAPKSVEKASPKSPTEEKSPVAKPDTTEKTVISEADSTEPPKKASNIVEDLEVNEAVSQTSKETTIPEGPPGVSPRESPKPQPITNMGSMPRSHVSRHGMRRSSRDRSPRYRHRSPTFTEPIPRSEDRPGTPTVDEPGIGHPGHPPPGPDYPSSRHYSTIPPSTIPPLIGVTHPPVIPGQGAVPGPFPPGQPPPGVYPPAQGPPLNYRLPPPAPYMPPGTYVPSRPPYESSRPPGSLPSYSSGYSHRSSRGRDYPPHSRSFRGRTPPRIIDDPLEAFNRMLREKDERERRAKHRRGRSYSRSSSRSFSRSPRRRSRSPRRRMSRSRSRSFSVSRSRSRSLSPIRNKGSPYRDFSPRVSPHRRGHSRYRSPVRSPPRYRYKEPPADHRSCDRDFEREREYPREGRGYSREREFRERDGRDYHYYDGYERERVKSKGQWSQGMGRGPPPTDAYYPPPASIHPQVPAYGQPNRYPSREPYPQYMGKPEPAHLPPIHQVPRKYEDIAPPGTEQPPVPGLEPTEKFEDRYPYEQPRTPVRDREVEKDKPESTEKREKKHRFSRTPERPTGSPKKEFMERHKRRRHDDSPDRENKRDSDKEKRKKEDSDEERVKKAKDKKKKKERKEAEKKKRKEKKEKREKKAEEKEKKVKDEKEPKKVKVSEEKELENKVDAKEEVKVAEKAKENTPPKENSPKPDLYGDLLTEGIDTTVVENYGKIEVSEEPNENTPPRKEEVEDQPLVEELEEGEMSKEYEDSEKDVLELHTNELELKLEKNEMLAPLPEKSKWEIDEDTPSTPSETSSRHEAKSDKPAKVTNEVLKRAENAIFAKAIKAIRPIEIKKISTDRAKLYSGERDRKTEDLGNHNIQVTLSRVDDDIEEVKPIEVPVEKPRLSVKERLGCKVDNLSRIVKVDRNSLSPFSKRPPDVGRNLERRIEVDDRRRRRSRERDRHSRSYRQQSDRHDSRRESYHHRDRERGSHRETHRRDESSKKDGRKTKREKSSSRSRTTHETDHKKEKRKRSRSVSENERDKRRRKDKKLKKEKIKKHHKKEDEMNEKEDGKGEKIEESKPKSATDRRKPTLDEANFEPDYDLETESEKEDVASKKQPSSSSGSDDDKKKDSSSSESSSSSSDEDRKKKKHRKHKKKKSRKDSSSSSSESESDSSDEERDRKRKKHKKKQKKKKKHK